MQDAQETKRQAKDAVTEIFKILRDMHAKMGGMHLRYVESFFYVSAQHAVHSLCSLGSMEQARTRVIQSGYTETQLASCLAQYEDLDVLMLNQSKTKITFSN